MAGELGLLEIRIVDVRQDGRFTLDTDDGHGHLLTELDIEQASLDRGTVHGVDGEGEELLPGLIINNHAGEVPRGLEFSAFGRDEGATTETAGVLREGVAVEADVSKTTGLLRLENLEAERLSTD